jgi:DNA-binding CsgD family transcriptional regulator
LLPSAEGAAIIAQVARATDSLFGRDSERAVIAGLLRKAGEADGSGGAVVVRGDPGIGKSSLLAAAALDARRWGMTTLTASGVESEAQLPFAGLHMLLQSRLHRLGALPAPQRRALEAAFGITDAAAPELFLIALATLELLADAATNAPLLVVAEDAQWLDQPSLDVLAFVARRVSVEPIVVLVAMRDGWPSAFEGAGVPEMRLEPLDDVAAAALLDERVPNLAPGLRDRLLAESAGNPLALVELPRALVQRGSFGLAVPLEPLPLTARLEHAFAARATELPSATRAALLVAAAHDGDDLTVVLGAAAAIDGTAGAADGLEPAISARLIETGEASVSFCHPLVRSAIYGAASPVDRRSAHAALADALVAEPDRQVWHRAASVVGADAAVAADLEEAATRARQRGATAVALAGLERAAKLSDDPALRGRRLLRAGEMAFELAGPDLGAGFLRAVEPLDLSPTERTRLSLLRELFEDEGLWAGEARIASFVETVDRVRRDGDADLALNFLMAVAQRCWWVNLSQATRELVVAAAESMPIPADDARLIAILAFADPVERGAAVIDHISRLDPDTGPDSASMRLVGAAATAVGAYDLSPGFLAASVDGLRAEGRLGLLAQALVSQAWAAVFLGNWNLATPAADEAGRLARETGQPRWAAAADLAESALAGMRGDHERAEQLADEAEQLLLPMVEHPTLAFAQLARGVSALGQGRYGYAYDSLRRMFDQADVAYHPFVRFWVIGDLAEAAARSRNADHVDEARALVDELAAMAQTSRSPLLRVGLAYARPLLAEPGAAEAPFDAALGAELGAWPFHRARLLLAFGSWLRRERRVAESRAPLRAARELFDALGAVPWGERARQELRATGETSRRRTPEAREQLTPQELQIAQMAADGLTNREIGQKLYLSHRTVGSHLYRLFPKLGVTSRSQLRKQLQPAPT